MLFVVKDFIVNSYLRVFRDDLFIFQFIRVRVLLNSLMPVRVFVPVLIMSMFVLVNKITPFKQLPV